MGWIANVLPHTTITSVWGNLIRSQVVQRFASPTERDAQTTGVRQSGMIAWTDSDHRLSVVDSDNNTWHDLRDVLPAIPEWRAGSFLWGNGAANFTATFSSPMSVVPVMMFSTGTLDIPSQGLWNYTAPWAAVTVNGFTITRANPSPGYSVQINYLAVPAH